MYVAGKERVLWRKLFLECEDFRNVRVIVDASAWEGCHRSSSAPSVVRAVQPGAG